MASDVPAILKYTRQVYYIGNLEFARLIPGEAHFYNLNGEEIEKQTTQIKWDAEAAEKAGFEHFMMKEIHEQPKAIQDTLNSVIKDGAIDFSALPILEPRIRKILLKWISDAMESVDFSARTDDGRRYRLDKSNMAEKCVVHCEDGNFTMPKMRIVFQEESV